MTTKAFMFDIDGTLIDKDYQMSEKTIYALKKLKEKGYILVANSGRPVFLCNQAYDKFLGKDFFDYTYGSNGAELYDAKTKEFKILHTLDSNQLYELTKIYSDNMFTFGVYDEEDSCFYVSKEPTYSGIEKFVKARNMECKVLDFSKNKKSYTKTVCLHEEDKYDEAVEFIKTHPCSFADACHSAKRGMEIVPKGISKGSAAYHLCENLNIKGEEIVSFGDSENDLEMLQATNGVIMGNASDFIKRKIKTHTTSIKEDGVYNYLIKNGYID